LRELVLDLAVRGKLVPQVVTDEISDTEICHGPFELPTTWKWSPLYAVARDLGQEVPKSNFHYIDVGSIDSSTGRISTEAAILSPANAPSRARKKVAFGTVIYSTIRPYLRNIAIVDREFEPKAIASTAFAVLHPGGLIDSKFLFACVRSPYFTRFVESKQKGVAYPAINASDLREARVPVPPIQEQNRIVAKIDELMALCDELESAQNQRDSIRASARKSSIDSFSIAMTPEDSNVAWNRIRNNWTTIADTSESIASIRSFVLDLAVRGKLSERHASDRAISTLVSDLESELVPYGEMSEVRFDIPSHWTWTPLASVVEHQLGKMLHTSKMRGTKIKYLRSVNVRKDGNIDLTDVKEMLIPESELEKYSVRVGDVFVNEGGDVGRNAIWLNDEDEEFAFQNQLHRLRPVCGVESRYVQFVLRHAKSSGVIAEMSSGVTIQHFSATAIRKLAFPLPPVEEQRRIVVKVNELMTMCDGLENSLLNRNELAKKISDALVSNIF
jgi:type I restriction enzyme S subunit